MNKTTVLLLLLVISLATLPTAQGQTPNSARVTVCSTPMPVVATANTGVGFLNFCVHYPESVQPGETAYVTSQFTGPTTVLPSFASAAAAFAPIAGCTEGTPSLATPSTNSVVGTQWTAFTSFTLSPGAESCVFTSIATLNVGTPAPLQVYNTALVLTIRTENARVDNFNYLCTAPGIAPNDYSTTGTTCNEQVFGGGNSTVNVAVNGTNVNIGLNVTGGNGTAVQETPGFNGSLYVLVMLFVLALAHLGEMRRDNQYRIIAGFITMIAGFIVVWELDRLGFNNVLNGYGLGFAMVWIGIHFWIATVLMIPKKWEV